MAVRSSRTTRGPLLTGIACLLCCSSVVQLAAAGKARTTVRSSTLTGVRLSSGSRQVPPRLPPATVATQGSAPGGSRAAEPAVKAPHQVGRPPQSPKAKLPEGVPTSEPRAATRRLVTRGPPDEAIGRTVAEDPELSELRRAEASLFPEPRQLGARGWPNQSWPSARGLVGTTELHATGLPPGALGPRARDTAPKSEFDAKWLQSLKLPDLPVRLDARVVKYLRFYRDTERGRNIARVWAKRSGRYVPGLQAHLRRSGLPVDLVWLSLIESGHDPGVRSRAGALGLWQFMPGTARMYGLTVDRWVDERLDPERATHAAMLFLTDLYQRFGSWELAMAAYNMGYGGLSRAIQKYNTNDYWTLSRMEAALPWETVLYVPKILAIAIVMKNKSAFGLADVVPEAPEHFDTISVTAGRSLEGVAAAAGIPLGELLALNPQLSAASTPPGDGVWQVHLPLGKGQAASAALAATPAAKTQVHVARFGDSLMAIAGERGLAVQSLLELNPYDATEVIGEGDRLLLPAHRAGAPTHATPLVAVVPPTSFQYPSRRRVFYEVRHGDLLREIAGVFGVTPHEIMLWNTLSKSAALQQGQVLQLFVDSARRLDRVRHATADQVTLLAAGSQAFHRHFQDEAGRIRVVIAARSGDTLSSIGRRYGMRAASMERINQRSRNERLEPGDRVIVYAKSWRVARSGDRVLEAEPAPPAPAPVREDLLPGSRELAAGNAGEPGALLPPADAILSSSPAQRR